MHATICGLGFDSERNTFTQSFGSNELDASLLLLALVGFLPADDPRVRGTVAAIERELMIDGSVLRYRSKTDIDGLPPGEGVFLPCSFWLANNYKLQHRDVEACALFGPPLSLRNDIGLLAEEYDPKAQRQRNFPQAFSHLALIGTALSLHDAGPAQQRGQGAKPPREAWVRVIFVPSDPDRCLPDLAMHLYAAGGDLRYSAYQSARSCPTVIKFMQPL
jgi:GH15 family glucan-1,4-alpha-glucosidase